MAYEDSASSDLDFSRLYIRAVIDEGSHFSKIAVQLIQPGRKRGKIEHVRFSENGKAKQLEQVFILLSNGELREGKARVDEYLEQNPRDAGDAIYNLKLCLLPKYRKSRYVTQVLSALHVPTEAGEKGVLAAIRDVYIPHFQSIRRRIIDHFERLAYGERLALDNDTQIEVLITVPVGLPDDARGLLLDAATTAGFSHIQLELEPICAAGEDLDGLAELNLLKPGDVMTIADLGCATLDITTMRYHASEIHTIGDPTGGPRGAHRVEELATQWLEKQCKEVADMGGIDEICRRLGHLPKVSFLRSFADHIVKYKQEVHMDTVCKVDIDGTGDFTGSGNNPISPADQLTTFHLRIPRERVEVWLYSWAKEVEKILKAHRQKLKNKVGDVLLLLGGGSKSMHLQRYLLDNKDGLGWAALKLSDSENPVATGGLKLFEKNVPDLRPEGIWWLSMTEEWDAKLHAKHPCSKWEPQYTEGSGKRRYLGQSLVPNKKLCKRSLAVPDVWEVTECLQRLLITTNSSSATTQRACTGYSAVVWCGPDIDECLELELYKSRNTASLRSTGRSISLRNENNRVKPGFEKWPIRFTDLPDLATMGFEPISGENDRYYYDIRTIVEMIADPYNIKLRVKLLAPGEDYKHKDDRSLDFEYAYNFVRILPSREVWDRNRSHQEREQKGRIFTQHPDQVGPSQFSIAPLSNQGTGVATGPTAKNAADLDSEALLAAMNHSTSESSTSQEIPQSGPALASGQGREQADASSLDDQIISSDHGSTPPSSVSPMEDQSFPPKAMRRGSREAGTTEDQHEATSIDLPRSNRHDHGTGSRLNLSTYPGMRTYNETPLWLSSGQKAFGTSKAPGRNTLSGRNSLWPPLERVEGGPSRSLTQYLSDSEPDEVPP